NQLDRVPVLLRNVSPDKNHWVGLQLIGGNKSPRDAVGSTVYLTAGGVRQRGDVLSGGSFASSNDQRIHFGLGTNTKIENLEIHWPSGRAQRVAVPGVDRFYVIQEGKGIVPGPYGEVHRAILPGAAR
ncbi:MAG: ASPIC/UnbV domain-containing protein, partial [Terriglobales bacterium]